MPKLKQLSLILSATTISMSGMASDFAFDRPGTSFSTSITPVGQLAWEQGLPSASYVESKDSNGIKSKVLSLNANTLLRTGLAKNTELQLGFTGPSWAQIKSEGQTLEDDGLGDVTVGLKQRIDLDDDKLKLAVLAQALIATGNDGFTEDEDIYTLGSSVEYQYNDLVNTGLSMFYAVQDGEWSITAVPTLNYEISGKLSGYSELVYSKKESQHNEYALGTGLIYALNDRAQFDASVGVDLDGDDRSYKAGLGVSYLF